MTSKTNMPRDVLAREISTLAGLTVEASADRAIAALTAAGYQITPVRADDGVRVEAAAQAAYEACISDNYPGGTPWRLLGEYLQSHWEDIATAALAAAGYQITPVRADDGVRVADDPRYCGDLSFMPAREDAEAQFKKDAHRWLDLRQPHVSNAAGHKARDRQEAEARFCLANSALALLWHMERPIAAADAVAGAERDAEVRDYEEAMASHRALVRELDVAMNGDGAARQASLCDIVEQLKDAVRDAARYRWIVGNADLVEVDSDERDERLSLGPKGSPEGFAIVIDALIDAELAPTQGVTAEADATRDNSSSRVLGS